MNDLTALAGFAGITALWSQIRALFQRIRALFITRVTLSGEVRLAVFDYLLTQGKVINWGDMNISSASTWVRPLDRVAEVAFETSPSQPRLCYIDGRLILFHAPTSPGNPNYPDSLVTLTGLRWQIKATDLIDRALKSAVTRQTTGNRYYVRRIGGHNNRGGSEPLRGNSTYPTSPPTEANQLRPSQKLLHWQPTDIGAPQPAEPFAAMSLCAQGMAAKADFDRWLGLKTWYQARGIPWRRGHLYYGPPGTGKTSIARALAQAADLPVFAFDLSSLDNERFLDAWQDMQERTPCMALIEDIDGTFDRRVNVAAAGDRREVLTFDCLLNAMGGIQTCDGVFIVLTTNHPEKLDEALGKPAFDGKGSTRPGRIDATFSLDLPNGDQRREILRRIIGPEHTTDDDVQKTKGHTAAQVTEYAIQTALRQQWQD